jgi:hypothetical protein
MGLLLIGDVIRNAASYEKDTIVYVPEGEAELTPFTQVLALQHGSHGPEAVEGYRYFLETGTMSEVLDGLQEQLGRVPTLLQQLRAVEYYAENDAYPDIETFRS